MVPADPLIHRGLRAELVVADVRALHYYAIARDRVGAALRLGIFLPTSGSPKARLSEYLTGFHC